MLQALYFCKPFREKVLEYKAKNKKGKETLLSCLADLFYSIATQKKKVGTIAPKKFIARLRKEKVDFDNYMQQDAHEFLNFLINHINEIIVCKLFSGCAQPHKCSWYINSNPEWYQIDPKLSRDDFRLIWYHSEFLKGPLFLKNFFVNMVLWSGSSPMN